MGWKIKLSRIKLVFIVTLVALLTGCAIPGSYFTTNNINHTVKVNGQKIDLPVIKVTPENLPQYKEQEYRVGKHDVLNIVVWQHPELTTGASGGDNSQGWSNNFLQQTSAHSSNRYKPGVLVDEDGNIFYPYAGTVHVEGKTVSQISNMLSKKLADYIKQPQVSVRVNQFRSEKAYLLGEISHQQIVPINDQPTDVLSAIGKSGGIGKAANSADIFVFRWNDGQPKVYWLNLGSPVGMMLAEHFILKDRDILYVAPAGVANWNRVISQVMPTLQTAWYTYRLSR